MLTYTHQLCTLLIFIPLKEPYYNLGSGRYKSIPTLPERSEGSLSEKWHFRFLDNPAGRWLGHNIPWWQPRGNFATRRLARYFYVGGSCSRSLTRPHTTQGLPVRVGYGKFRLKPSLVCSVVPHPEPKSPDSLKAGIKSFLFPISHTCMAWMVVVSWFIILYYSTQFPGSSIPPILYR
jgi:hypothetical protein